MFKALYIDNGDGNGPKRNPDITDEEYAAAIIEIRASNVSALCQAAHDYEFSQINGSAVSLLAVGVQRQLPKSLEVMAWTQSIWKLYYDRKPTVTFTCDNALYDFSQCGSIPHSIPDMIAEVLA